MKTKFNYLFLLTSLWICFAAHATAPLSGSGKFMFTNTQNEPIEIYYFVPNKIDDETSVVVVVPGAGRNGWDYRDAWQSNAEKHNWVIISPSYSEKYYPRFWNYNLAKMIENVVINDAKTAISDYTVNDNSSTWICNDFDVLFLELKRRLNLQGNDYNAFGHSAGGQVLHRCVMAGYLLKANLILASNSGWYTTTERSEAFPYGLKDAPFQPSVLRDAFAKNLVVFLGGNDNEHERRGHLVRNSQLDKQGIHRLARGLNFYEKAMTKSQSLGYEFNWSLYVVQNVGHDYKTMSAEAATFISEEN